MVLRFADASIRSNILLPTCDSRIRIRRTSTTFLTTPTGRVYAFHMQAKQELLQLKERLQKQILVLETEMTTVDKAIQLLDRESRVVAQGPRRTRDSPGWGWLTLAVKS